MRLEENEFKKKLSDGISEGGRYLWSVLERFGGSCDCGACDGETSAKDRTRRHFTLGSGVSDNSSATGRSEEREETRTPANR